MKYKLLFVTFQVGCTNQLYPIADQMRREGHRIEIVSCGKSSDKWKEYLFSPLGKTPSMAIEEIRDCIRGSAPNLIVTGSNAVNSFEYNFRVEGKKTGIPTLTFLDYWSKYRERFFRNDSDESVPDLVLTVETTAKDGLVDAGISPERVAVVGSTFYEYLHWKYEKVFTNGCRKNCDKILFVSQPVQSLYGDSLGYTEFTILSAVYRIFKESGVRYPVIIKPHPREDVKALKEFVSINTMQDLFSVDTESDLYDLILSSAFTVGLFSNTLIESLILGKKSWSLQLGGKGKFRFFASEAGIVETIYREDDLRVFASGIGRRSQETDRKDYSYLYKGALQKAMSHCYSLMRGWQALNI